MNKSVDIFQGEVDGFNTQCWIDPISDDERAVYLCWGWITITFPLDSFVRFAKMVKACADKIQAIDAGSTEQENRADITLKQIEESSHCCPECNKKEDRE